MNFKVGDKVRFECGRHSQNPRWDYRLDGSPVDFGASDKWEPAIVHEVLCTGIIQIAWISSKGYPQIWCFNKQTAKYLVSVLKCECGSHTLWGENAAHSHWCPSSPHYKEGK